MKLRNLLLTGLSFVLVAAVSIGGTLAYLTSTADDVNVMTLGNVEIKQHEYQRVTNDDGSYKTDTIDGQISYVLEAFEQGKALLPIVGDPNEPGNSPAYAGYDNTIVRMTQVDSYGSMQVFAGKNAQDKFVTVENTGKSDAYVRTLVAIENGTGDANLIGIGSRCVAAEKAATSTAPWVSNYIGQIIVDGNTYGLFEYVYRGASDVSRHVNGVLPAGDTTYPSLCQVYLKHNSTNEDMEAIDGNGNGTLDILVLSQAVQVDGFADAKTALDTAFGKASEKGAEWFGGMGKVQFVEAETGMTQLEGEAAKEILESLEAGNDLIVDEKMDLLGFDTTEVDAKGATATLNGVGPEAYGYLAFLPDAGEDVTVENLNVTGSGFVEIGHYGIGGGTYTVNNLKIENLASTLKNGNKGFNLACAFMANGDATLNNCVITGTTAVQDGAMPVDLACGQAWKGYKDDNDNKVSTTVNGGEYGTVYCWEHSIVEINGAKIDTLYAAPIGGTVTIKPGTHIGTINVDYGTSDKYATATNLAKLFIEDGATVDAIVFGGSTYTVAQWNEFVASL